MSSRESGGILSLISKLRRCAPHILPGITHRRELALLELQEMSRKCAVSFAVGAAAAFFLCLVALTLTFIVAAVYWDTPHRVTALWFLAGAEALLGLAGLAWLWLSWRNWRFFQTTLEQFEKDSECLAQILQNPKTAAATSAVTKN